MATAVGSSSFVPSLRAQDLRNLHSMPQLLAALHHNLRAISSPLSYEQLQRNENVAYQFDIKH